LINIACFLPELAHAANMGKSFVKHMLATAIIN
jgi:hypothetical protein